MSINPAKIDKVKVESFEYPTNAALKAAAVNHITVFLTGKSRSCAGPICSDCRVSMLIYNLLGGLEMFSACDSRYIKNCHASGLHNESCRPSKANTRTYELPGSKSQSE